MWPMTAAVAVTAVDAVAAVEVRAAAMATTVAATVATLGAGRCRSKHGKAECSARGNGQKGRFVIHEHSPLIPGDR